jgi:two-component system response regulator PilR (NtrC family)
VDLFYRLIVINLHLPALRERPEDIPLLADHFLLKHGAAQNKRLGFSPDALRWLVAQSFRGNVRELENLVERAVTLALGARIELPDLTGDTLAGLPVLATAPVQIPDEGFDLDGHLANIERQVLVGALAKAGGVRKDAATLLRMSFRSFRYRLAKYGLGDSDEIEHELAEGA